MLAHRAVSVEPLRDLFVREARGTLWLLLGMVGVVLLIACGNVANLLLARAAARQREIAIRAALGAQPRDIMRQFLTESLLLALAGGTLGLLLSLWLVEALTAWLPAEVPQLSGLTPDWRVLLFTLGAALLTGLLCGLAPAFTARRGNLIETINDGGRSATGNALRGRLRNALVVGEVALALTLLVAAGLLLNSLLRLNRVQPGFAVENTLTLQFSLSGARYRGALERPDKLNSFLSALTERIKALPGVAAVAQAQCVPLTGQENNTGFQIVGSTTGEKPAAQLRFISPGYFDALQIPLRAGRVFTERDTPQAPTVMLVNEAFVREHLRGVNPVGQKLKLGWGGEAPKEIVGVVGDVRHRSLSDMARAEMYVPQAQFANAGITLIVRTEQVKPESLVNAVKEQVRALDPTLPLTAIKTLAGYREEALALPRFNTFLLGVFAALALMLTLIGLYSVLSYSVTQRIPEIGLRMALGAQPGDVLRMVVGQGMKLVGLGLLLGWASALVVTRFLQSWLYAVDARDPLTFASVALLLTSVAALACYLPARRATQVDPLIALRCD